jgi:integrase
LVNSTKISDRFFLSRTGCAIQESNMSKYFAEMFKSCSGRENITPHSLRHLFASNVDYRNPDQLKVAAKYMAHSVNTLETVYAETTEKGQILLPSIL